MLRWRPWPGGGHMAQAPFPSNALLTRLSAVFSDAPRVQIMGAPQHPPGTFLRGIDDVFGLIVHETDGWPSRNKTTSWINGYTANPGAGTGPQGAIWADGTVMQLVDLPFRTWHAEFLNSRT